MGKDGSITLHKGATTVPEPIAAYLRHVDPTTRDALNTWLTDRGAPVQFTAGASEFELNWSDPPFAELECGVEFSFGSHRILVAFDGFAAIDPLLVGEPFASMPSAMRELVLQRIIAHFLGALPPSLSESADIRAIHWGADALPRWACAIGWVLRRLPKGTMSRGMLAVESADTMAWLHSNLPAPEKKAEARVNVPIGLSLILGRTGLDLKSLRGMTVGDVTWIENAGHTRGGVSVLLAAPQNGPQWSCRLKHTTLQVIEVAGGDARRNADIVGRARVVEPKTAGDYSMSRESAMEIPVTFDLGDVTVPLQSLEKIQAGYLFELPQDIAHATVRMRVAGTLIAEGQLIVIGKRLGVRITKIHAERETVSS